MEAAPPEPPPSLGDQHELPEDPKTNITLPNADEIQYHDKRLLVIFFDFSYMGVPEQLRAQEAALKYIDYADDAVRPDGDPALHQHRAGEDRFHRQPRCSLKTS